MAGGLVLRADCARPQKEKSRLSAGLSFYGLPECELSSALALLIGVLALTVRVLLLLAGLLTGALLLAGLLTRVLILLARVLILVRHSGISLAERGVHGERDGRNQCGRPILVSAGYPVPLRSLQGGAMSSLWQAEPPAT
jgi:hypothetical protein